MLVLTALARAADPCAFTASLAQAWTTWEASDDAAYRAAVTAVLADLGCLRTPLSTAEVVAVHTAVARLAWLDAQAGVPGVAAREEAALRGLAQADPAAPTPAPLDQDPALIRAREAEITSGPRLRAGSWTVNAKPATCLPGDAAAIVQNQDSAWYVLPGEAPRALMRHPSVGLAIAGGAGLALGGAALGLAASTESRFLAEPDDLVAARLESANHAWAVGGITALGAGLGLGTAAILVGTW